MNDLFSGSFFSHSRTTSQNEAQMSSATGTGGANLDKFFSDVEAIKDDLKEIETMYSDLKSSNEESKTVHSSRSMKDLRAKMDRDVSLALKKAKLIKVRLEGLDRANVANRQVPGCGPGSSADRTRSSVVSGVRKKLKEKMDEFQELRERIGMEHRETVERRYFTVTGENPDEKTVDLLISTGQSENFLQKAIQEQGRGRIVDTISEIQERHDAVKDMEKNLKELHQVFLDMAVLVQYQGEHLDDIEANVQRANSFVTGGTRQLQVARKHQKNTRKWTCYAIILVLAIILFVVLFTVKPWE